MGQIRELKAKIKALEEANAKLRGDKLAKKGDESAIAVDKMLAPYLVAKEGKTPKGATFTYNGLDHEKHKSLSVEYKGSNGHTKVDGPYARVGSARQVAEAYHRMGALVRITATPKLTRAAEEARHTAQVAEQERAVARLKQMGIKS